PQVHVDVAHAEVAVERHATEGAAECRLTECLDRVERHVPVRGGIRAVLQARRQRVDEGDGIRHRVRVQSHDGYAAQVVSVQVIADRGRQVGKSCVAQRIAVEVTDGVAGGAGAGYATAIQNLVRVHPAHQAAIRVAGPVARIERSQTDPGVVVGAAHAV